jgi:hypothetical protein
MKQGVKFTSTSDFNAFMFCTSQEDSKNLALDKKFGEYAIEIVDLGCFADMVSKKLAEEIFLSQTIKVMGESDSVIAGHAKVVYCSKDSIDYDELYKTIGKPELNINGAFIKPSDEGFEEENEYRFIWLPFHTPSQSMSSIPMSFEYIDLSIPELGDVLKPVT